MTPSTNDRFTGVVVSCNEDVKSVAGLIFCKDFASTLSFCARKEKGSLIPEYGQLVEFRKNGDNIDIQSLGRIFIINDELAATLENVKLSREDDPAAFPFTLSFFHNLFGKVLVPAGNHTEPGMTITLKLIYNNMLIPGFSWFGASIRDSKQGNFVAIVGTKRPSSIRTHGNPMEQSFNPISPQKSKADSEKSGPSFKDSLVVCREGEVEFEEMYHEDDQEAHFDYDLYINSLNPHLHSLFLQKKPAVHFPVLRVKKDSLPQCEDKVLILLRCADFAIGISYPYNVIGVIRLHEEEAAKNANTGNIVMCQTQDVNNHDIYGFVGDKCSQHIGTHNVKASYKSYFEAGRENEMAGVWANINLLISSTDILEPELDAENQRFSSTFAFGSIFFDEGCNTFLEENASAPFMFRIALMLVPVKNETCTPIWIADPETFHTLPESS